MSVFDIAAYARVQSWRALTMYVQEKPFETVESRKSLPHTGRHATMTGKKEQ